MDVEAAVQVEEWEEDMTVRCTRSRRRMWRTGAEGTVMPPPRLSCGAETRAKLATAL